MNTKERQCKSVEISFQLNSQTSKNNQEKKSDRRCSSAFSPVLKTEWNTEIEDECDLEIYGIITGDKSLEELVFISDGNEDVILEESIHYVSRCSLSLEW